MCLLRRHLELILLLIHFHTLSFSHFHTLSVAYSGGKRLKTSTFKACSFVVSSRCLSCVPSVLLWLSSSDVKKKSRSLRAHRCLSFSLSNTSRTPFDLLGVTNDLMTSSPTSCLSWELDGWSIVISGVQGASGVEGSGSKSANIGSSLSDAKASWSMVGRLSVRGSGSKFTFGSLNWKKRNIFSLVSYQ